MHIRFISVFLHTMGLDWPRRLEQRFPSWNAENLASSASVSRIFRSTIMTPTVSVLFFLNFFFSLANSCKQTRAASPLYNILLSVELGIPPALFFPSSLAATSEFLGERSFQTGSYSYCPFIVNTQVSLFSLPSLPILILDLQVARPSRSASLLLFTMTLTRQRRPRNPDEFPTIQLFILGKKDLPIHGCK